MDRVLQEASKGADQGGRGSGKAGGGQGGLSEAQMEELEMLYGLDQPLLVAYGQWLGVTPREIWVSKGDFSGDSVRLTRQSDGEAVEVFRDGRVVGAKGEDLRAEGWKVRVETQGQRREKFLQRHAGAKDAPVYMDRAVLYQTRFAGLLQGDLGRSMIYQDSVAQMMWERVPVATYFGILSALLTYGICVPLGIAKALKHRTYFDNVTSLLIFMGYSIPGFALGAILLVHFGARMNWFPLSGLVSGDFATLSFFEQVKDLAWHTALPLLSYVVGGFALLTMMVKNSLLDHLTSDYMRTAVAKGASFRRAVFCHALRNSMIPVATTLGNLVTIFISGSMLVESVFDIQGFGLLQYQSVLDRDIPVIMGTLTVAAALMLVGNLLSDVAVALVDPRIQFE